LTIFALAHWAAITQGSKSLEVFCFSLLFSLVAIANIRRPFHGKVHVTDYAFERARQGMQTSLSSGPTVAQVAS
jgi:hypothetical protein